MIYDYSKLLGRIVEKVRTQGKLAEIMGKSERTISLKLNNKIPWTQAEMLQVCKILDIDIRDIHLYFFAQIVQV